MVTINAIDTARIDHIMKDMNALSERFSGVIGQSHFVEVCVVNLDGDYLATMTINRFNGDHIFNLCDFTEDYTLESAFEVKLEDDSDAKAVMKQLIAHAIDQIEFDFSI